MTRVLRSPAAILSAIRDESGAATIWAVAWLFIFMLLGGVAVDVSNAYAMKSRLQSVADASALAAVMQIDDRTAARAAAVLLAARNMPDDAKGNVITSSDVRFGVWDADTGAFVEVADDEPAEAVRILAGRTLGRGNAVPTYLVRLVGHNEWELGAASTATTSGRTAPPPPVGGPDCSAATILSTAGLSAGAISGEINLGGNNYFGPGVCLYAEQGLQVGGNNCFELGAHIVSPDSDLNRVNPLKCGEEEDVVVEHSLEPKLMPELHDGLFDVIYAAVNNAGKTWGDNETPEQIALLPRHLIGAHIQRVNMGSWSVQEDHLREDTIYLVDHDVQFTGGTQISNAAFIVNGRLGINGGKDLSFDNIFFFSKGRLNFTNNTTMGSEENLCKDGEFRVYLFSEEDLSLGGGNASTSVYGLMGAAPGFDPGGGLKSAKGLYIETEGYTSLGGGANLTGCEKPLASIYDHLFQENPNTLFDPLPPVPGTVLGASLVQ